ncbi:MAG TPA: stage II sporulation protein E [Lachnospiraceae bacterium]|nr:stage II sporulation protein E [Lachnospiraceae bacterium]
MKGITKRGFVISTIGVFVARAAFLSMNPIAIGYFGAAFVEKAMRPFLLLGIIVGTATAMPAVETIKYTLVIIIISIIVSLIESRNRSKAVSIPIIAIISSLVTGALSLTKCMLSNDVRSQLIFALLECVLIFSLTFIFSKCIKFFLYGGIGQALDNELLISITIMTAIIIYAMPEINTVDFSLTKTATFFIVLIMGYKYGAGAGAITGTACGIVNGLHSYIGVYSETIGEHFLPIVGIMCTLGILVGMFREVGRIGTSIAYVAGVIGASYVYKDFILSSTQIGAIVSSVILFVLFPTSLMKRVQGKRDRWNDMQFLEQNIQNMTKEKLRGISESFSKLSSTFHTIAQTRTSLSRQEVDGIFDDLSDRLCKNCSNCSVCWKNDFYDTYKAAFSILNSIEENGYISEVDIPTSFAKRCINLGEFLAETNRSLEVAKINLNWTNRMAESREAIAGQLGEVAAIIDDFSKDVGNMITVNSNEEIAIINRLKLNHIQVKQISILERRNKRQEIYMVIRTEKGRCITTREAATIIGEALGRKVRPDEGSKNIISKDFEKFVFTEDTVFKTLTGIARIPKSGEQISGDNFSFLELATGDMIMTLSDGMGSGKLACEESESVVELLEQLIEAGFKEESAIKLINSILVTKSESQIFSTVDMSILNLHTGICDFIKIGASTTFIKRENWVETITSTTLPVGMFNHVDFDGISKKMYDGDYIVMVTDGVLDCIKDEDKLGIMESIISEIKCHNPQEIAELILEKAMGHNNNTPVDDMTVLVAGVWKKY